MSEGGYKFPSYPKLTWGCNAPFNVWIRLMTIPKIIHHIAPSNKNNWHPSWFPCFDTWHKHFPEDDYQHILWDDFSGIDLIVRDHYPEYWNFYRDLPFHIMKIDFARYCILHKYGGIYTDMDMLCYKNFYDVLDEKLILLESYPEFDELVLNCLMISEENNDFFLDCMNQAVEENNNFNSIMSTNVDEYFVRSVTGPYLLSKVLSQSENIEIKLLPKEYFNPLLDHRGGDYYTRHIMTGHWGIEVIEENKKNNKRRFENLPFDEFLIQVYNESENIDLMNFLKEEIKN